MTAKDLPSWSLHSSHEDNERVNTVSMDCEMCSGRGKEGGVIIHRWGRHILNLVGGEVF